MNYRQEIRNTERNAAYYAALALVQRLDPKPCHDSYWHIGGRRCDTLDEALAALECCERAELKIAA